jgi:hypothetical protein
MGGGASQGYTGLVQDYRVSYVRSAFPFWVVEHPDGEEIASSPEQVMAHVGRLVRDKIGKGGSSEFRIFWDTIPDGFKAPDLQLTLEETKPTSRH